MVEKILTLKLLKGSYGVCRLKEKATIPSWAFEGEFYSITKTEDELSIVCLESNITEEVKSEKDWKVLKIEGPLDFSLVGILSKISTTLAENNISIFAISTYDTDYILVKGKDIDKSIEVLLDSNYHVIR